MLLPCSRRIGQEQGEVADNEVITIRNAGLISKPVILEPQAGVRFSGVFQNVGRWSIPRWESHVEDVPTESLGPRQIKTQALVLTAIIASTTMRVVAMVGLLSLVTPSALVGV